MRNKRLAQIVLGFFLLSTLLLAATCAPKRVATERRPSREERKVVGKGVYHVVQRHQTLYRICKTYGVDIHEVAPINGIADPSKIQAGQRIFIPGVRKVLKVEIVLDDVAAEQVEAGTEGAKTPHERMGFTWPVEGRLGDGFEDDERKRHQGIDIRASTGTLNRAAQAGTVIYSGNTIRGYGNMVIIRHSQEYVTVYAHNQVNLVEERDRIEKGQVIGKVGQTGRTTGPHLHFEIRRNNKPVDPMLYLK